MRSVYMWCIREIRWCWNTNKQCFKWTEKDKDWVSGWVWNDVIMEWGMRKAERHNAKELLCIACSAWFYQKLRVLIIMVSWLVFSLPLSLAHSSFNSRVIQRLCGSGNVVVFVIAANNNIQEASNTCCKWWCYMKTFRTVRETRHSSLLYRLTSSSSLY